MVNTDILFKEIVIETPVDKIIKQIRALIISGQLKPGDKLPSERKLSERLRVSRSYVRVAIQKLEFYGILRTLPQSGTVVSGVGITALKGLISDVLKIENTDFSSLVETRVLLETEAARLAAIRRTDKDIVVMKQALSAYERQIQSGGKAVEEDLMFHLKITEASKNSVLKSLMLVITPDIIKSFNMYNVCEGGRLYRSMAEHKGILEHIIKQNPDEAAAAMKVHLQEVLEFSQTFKQE